MRECYLGNNMVEIKIDNYSINIDAILYLKNRLLEKKKDDEKWFNFWNGTPDVEKAFKDDILFYIDNSDESTEFRVEAKIKKGKLPEYPYINRTTDDGWVVVDNFKLDDYHSMFLEIGNEFRVIPNQKTMKQLMLEREVFTALGINLK